MKKIIISTIVCVIILLGVTLLYDNNLIQNANIFQSDFKKEELESKYITGNSYYYSLLSEEEKEIYLKVEEAIDKLNESISFNTKSEDVKIKDSISRAINAYIYDNPRVFYLSSDYKIVISNFVISKKVEIKLSYYMKDKEQIQECLSKMDSRVGEIINQNVKQNMSNYNKELVVHDFLVSSIKYYDYTDINSIPSVKHTAYGALVDKEAVCDGISKAFMIIMEELGIKCILATGVTNNVPHAWNIVELDGDYYNVDLTSNQIEEDGKNIPMHAYFNITNEELLKTHTIDKKFGIYEAIGTKYNYYAKQNYIIDSFEVTKVKLNTIIFNSVNNKVLEFKISDSKAKEEEIANLLYTLNFNEYQTRGKTKISYRKVKDIYVIVKD